MKLSIITINKDNVDGLRRTMESVATQTFKDFEYIVVDGASTDGSVEVMDEWTQKISTAGVPVNAKSEPDTGLYNAMNKGIRKAEGEYVLCLNSGDFLINAGVLEKASSQSIWADVVTARCNVSKGGIVVWTSPFLPSITLHTLYMVGIPHQSSFIKRCLFEQYGYYREDFRYNSDIEFWYKTILFGGVTTQGVDVVMTDYDNNGISSVQNRSDAYKTEMMEILSEGNLPRILPDYDVWARERTVLKKYAWIEEHPILERCLAFYYKVCKHI